MIAPKLVAIATAELGVEELHGTNTGVRVDQYKAATKLPPKESWAWCAAFICWLVMQAMGTDTYTFSRPTTAGAWDFERWSLAQDASTQLRKPHRGDIKPGDIVIFTFSHIGLATSSPDANGNVHTIEGNTDAKGSREGGGVFAKVRHVSEIRSRIRFTV